VKPSSSIKKFYHKHSEQIRITPRVLKIIATVPQFIMRKYVLDVGCGNEFITKCMSVYTTIKGIDIDDSILEYKSPIQYDAVTCFDVLEHVGDLVTALDNIRRICKNEGLMIINQPEQTDKSQPIDNIVELKTLMGLGKLIYLENYRFSENESYNFMVFQKNENIIN